MVARTGVVVGGGIGGLAAAIALRRAGWDVTVLERSAEGGEIGAGLTIMANGQRALRELGLAAAVGASAVPQGGGGVRDRSGRWLARVDGAALERELGTSVIGIHREQLHRVLRAALPAGALVTGAEVVDVTAGPPASVTVVRDGQRHTVTAELVVGADGIRSAVRRRLWPAHPGPAHTGVTAWRSVTADRWPLDLVGAVTWGPGTEFGTVPLVDGRVYWFAAVAGAPVGHRFADEAGHLWARFAGWHAPIPELLAATEPGAVLRHDLHHLAVPLPGYVTGAVALLGDAAHAMTPNLGQGAAQALEDAVVLGRALARYDDDVPTALRVYDRTRRPRSQAVARASRWSGRFGHELRSAPLVAVRDLLVRATPAAVALSSLARFAHWEPELVEA
ncbi:FAD-dependent monooxygenase [Georgenia satyanarayanai]|uniref:FAD-dependent monooxygenase n=1 Tax=Georgenia satyanarayanai TaxID=860221 RepID=UPI0012648448|nr:FAD-dependent monooxygenase [Georgenia satyanarayanai]